MPKNTEITAIIDKYVDGLPPLVSVRPAAEIHGSSPDHIYRLAGRGRVRFLKDGRRTKVDTASLLADMANLPEAKIAMNARDRQRAAKSEAAKQRQATESDARSTTA
jgi:hypothetical protein